MDEYDPITSLEHAIGRRIATWSMVAVLLVFVCGLVAPIFGPWIKQLRRRAHVMSPNYEALASADMVAIYPVLWGWAILCWIILIWATAKYPTIY